LSKQLSQGFTLPDNLRATQDIHAAVKHGNLILIVIPTPFVGKVVSQVVDEISGDQVCSLEFDVLTICTGAVMTMLTITDSVCRFYVAVPRGF